MKAGSLWAREDEGDLNDGPCLGGALGGFAGGHLPPFLVCLRLSVVFCGGGYNQGMDVSNVKTTCT